AMDVIASRREFLDDMQARLTELAASGSALDDRSKAFRARLEIAEGRLVSVTRQADEVGRIANLLTMGSGAVSDAQYRAADVVRTIASLEERADDLRDVGERVRVLGQDLGQRQDTLEKASAHLARASELRQEVAAAVQQLEDRS